MPEKRPVPLSLRILLGVAAGAALGAAFGTHEIVPGLDSQDLGTLGLLFVRLLKALAIPLIFLAILTRCCAPRSARARARSCC
jgi:Na+/H+-dicarboxylate symporter